MKRFALLLPLGAFLAFAAPDLARADAILRPAVTVSGDVVKLGDLFDNIDPDKAERPIARSPQPGRRAVVDADWLQKVANSNGIKWRAASAFEQTVVERPGMSITREQIEGEILAALASAAIPEGAEVELANRNLSFVIPVDGDARVGVRDLTYDERYRRFSATIEVPADAPGAQRLRVSGRIFTTIDVPVLAHPVARGEVISARDLTWQRAREDGLRRDIVTDIDQIVGMTPRQTLRSGQMVSLNDVQKPIAVKRGALVTMVLRNGAMALTAQGRAVEQGSVGDIVHLTNTHSNLTVEGRVEGPNLVSVMPNAGLALAN